MTEFSPPDGWVAAADTDDGGASLATELEREVAPGHVLHGVAVRALARCDGHCDDALFELGDGRLALVHLSYPADGPDRPPWPVTTWFADVDAAMGHLADHLLDDGA